MKRLLLPLLLLAASPALAQSQGQGRSEQVAYSPNSVFNVTGHPALAMMAGLSDEGLPLSVQFAARHGDEATLFAVGKDFLGE